MAPREWLGIWQCLPSRCKGEAPWAANGMISAAVRRYLGKHVGPHLNNEKQAKLEV